MVFEALSTFGFGCTLPQGAYYIMADIRPLSDLDDVAFARYLTEKVGVAPVPGTSFYHEPELGRHAVRFTFSKTEETLREAARRLAALRS